MWGQPPSAVRRAKLDDLASTIRGHAERSRIVRRTVLRSREPALSEAEGDLQQHRSAPRYEKCPAAISCRLTSSQSANIIFRKFRGGRSLFLQLGPVYFPSASCLTISAR